MEIYVIQPGDTLFTIAQRFGVSLQALINLNQLPNPERLVPGQAILIPVTPPTPLRYTVVAGDTLYLLAQLFNTTVNELVRVNNIADPNRIQVGTVLTIPGWSQVPYTVSSGDTLYQIANRFNTPLNLIVKVNQIANPALIFPGQVLIIPIAVPPVIKTSIETFAYFQLTNLNALERSLANIGPYITYGALFQFPINATGDITVSENTARAVSILKRFNVQPLMAITNWGPTGFELDLARAIIGNPTVKARTINNLLSLLSQYGFAGVNVDFENMYPEDRQLFTDFLRDMTAALRSQGFLVTVAVPPKFSDQPTLPWVGTFDYAAIGQIVDIVFLMAYEWGWIGGPPQAIAPVNLVRRALNYAVTQIPRSKIIQGVPFYGYDWTLPQTPERPAVPVNLVAVYNLAANAGATINYDAVAQSPWFRYYDPQGVQHEVWFEDARSIEAKYLVNKEFGVRGLGWWSYINEPYGFPQSWSILNEYFNVRKL